MATKNTIDGVVKKLSVFDDRYGIKLDNGEWYNEFGSPPDFIREGEGVIVHFQNAHKGGKTYHNIQKVEPFSGPEKIPTQDINAKGEKDAVDKAWDIRTNEAKRIMENCYRNATEILGHKPTGEETAIVNTMFIFATKK